MTTPIPSIKRREIKQVLNETKRQIDTLQLQLLAPPSSLDPIAMLEFEERSHRDVGLLADLHFMRQIFLAHLNDDFRADAARQARSQRRAQGDERHLLSKGWKYTTITLRHGLRLALWTPYARPSLLGKRGPKRTKRGKQGSGLYPVLQALGITDCVSAATRSEVTRQLLQCGSFEEARAQLSRDGFILDVSTLSKIALSLGYDAIKLRNSALDKARKTPLQRGGNLQGKQLRVSVDGGRTKARKIKKYARVGKNGRRAFETFWREPRIITLDVLTDDGEVDREWGQIYEVSLGEAEEVFNILLGLLRLLRAHEAKIVEFVTDGALWIWTRVSSLMSQAGIKAERVRLVLDYYHACEYISKALAECKNLSLSEKTSEYKRLSQKLKAEGGADIVIQSLKALARGRRAKAIKEKIAYLDNHREHMHYHALKKEKLSIGSGVVESAVRRVINLRFKAASMAWREDNLEPLIYMRGILKSNRWDDFIHGSLRDHYYLSEFVPSSEETSELCAIPMAA